MTKLTLNHYVSKDEITSPEMLEKVKEKFVEIGGGKDPGLGQWDEREKFGNEHFAIGILKSGSIGWISKATARHKVNIF